jgi:hypothetical protein
MTLLFKQPPAGSPASFDPGALFLVLFGAGLAFLGALILRLGAQAWRLRRPIVVPTRLAMPVIGLLVLAEFARFGRRVTRSSREWGTTGDWLTLGVTLVAVAIAVTLQMRATARKLHVGGLAFDRGRQLARAALQAVAPDSKLIADEGDGSIVRLGKEGPGLQTQSKQLFGLVIFKVVGDLPAATRDELFSGIARCLDAEELAVPRGLIVRVCATGAVLVVLGVVLTVAISVAGP